MTFLSIIIPFDRPLRYLKDCLDSLSEQKMEDTEVPGPLLKNNDEVVEAISNIGRIEKEYNERYDEFYDRFCSIEDGNASQRIYNRLWK